MADLMFAFTMVVSTAKVRTGNSFTSTGHFASWSVRTLVGTPFCFAGVLVHRVGVAKWEDVGLSEGRGCAQPLIINHNHRRQRSYQMRAPMT